MDQKFMNFPGIQEEFDFLLYIRVELLALHSWGGKQSLLLNCWERGAQQEIPFFSGTCNYDNLFLKK